MARHKKKAKPTGPQEHRSIAKNRKARHDFEIIEEMEVGISLLGTEVKSLRDGVCSLQEAFIRLQDGELTLMRAHIPEYAFGNKQNHEVLRPRKLLAHRKEITKWEKAYKEQGTTIIPLEIYFFKSKVKLHIALVRGKKQHDKRADLKSAQDKRAIDRAFARKDR
ncbi:MAG: SsrA-binding protein SmpB [Planctomycetota bacterium]|nr:SsrA-binding protein SmpB [Planctomycetota bacterium]